MADITWQKLIVQTDGTDFSTANEAGAAVRLRNSDSAGTNSSEYIGNVAGSGTFSEKGNGYWNIEIDSADSGWFLIQSYTTATAVWADVPGLAPIEIVVAEMLQLSGGTMTGAIAMGDNSVTLVDTITFQDEDGTIAGIANKNLVDKAATEELSGNNIYSGDCTFSGTNSVTGEMDFTTNLLKVNSIVIQPYIYVSRSFPGTGGRAPASVDGTIFIADDAYEVVSVVISSDVRETTNPDTHIQLEKLADTEAPAAGADILEDSGGLGIDLGSTAREPITGTVNKTNGTLADGNRLGLYLDNEAADLEGVCITVKMKRV